MPQLNVETTWPTKLREAVQGYLEKVIDGPPEYEYASNIRLARAGNAEECEEYRVQMAHGCCGFYDEIREVEGVLVLIGFNYGH